MRDIKFRGKGENSGEWLYGDIRHSTDGYYIFKQGGRYGDAVKSQTIGQFTGLHDKNGKEIYEGDVVECVSWNEYFSRDGQPMEPFRRKMFVDFCKGGFKMVEPMPDPMTDNEWDIIFNGDIVILGNIHDNPQLLSKQNWQHETNKPSLH